MGENEREPKSRHGTWTRAGSDAPAPPVFVGNIMVLIAVAMLFDDDPHEPDGDSA
jgi:hypothetical protein